MFRKSERKRHPVWTGTVTALSVLGACRFFSVMKSALEKMKIGGCRKKAETGNED